MRITTIEPQKKNPSRRNIYADGEFVLGVSAETLLRFGLRVGDAMPPTLIKAIEKADELVGARGVALRFLSVRPRTEREIRDKLREKEFGDEEIAQTITALKSAGLLDDATFARMYIRDALAGRPAGKMLLKRKLLLLGVEKSIVQDALEETFTGVDVHATALALAKQFIRKTQNLKKGETPVKRRNRVSSFLARKGYGWDVIEGVLKQVLTDSDESEG
jgi:regulatory protein